MATVNALSVALFNAAAGGYAAEMTANPAGFANAVGPILEKDVSTDALFVDHLLGNLGVTSSNDVYAQAKAAVAALVTTKGRAGAATDAIDFLKAQEGSTNAYATIAANFAAKVNAAAAFTAANATERDITKLISGVTGVDTDAAAIAAATAAVEAAAATAAAAAATKAAADLAAANAAAEAAATAAAAALAAAEAEAAADLAAANAAAEVAATAAAAALAAAEAEAAADLAAANAAAEAAATKAAADLATANATITSLQNPTGGSFALTSASDTKIGVGRADAFTGTSTTYTAGDIIVDSGVGDADTLTVTATGDISATPFVVGIENVNFALSTVDASGDATFTVDAANIAASGITLSATKTGNVITTAAIDNVKSGASVSSAFANMAVSTAANADVTISGTRSAGTTLSQTGTADTLNITTTGALTITGTTAEESITVNSGGAVSITDSTATAAGDDVAYVVNAAGAITIADITDTGSLVATTSTGTITVGSTDLHTDGDITLTTNNGNVVVANADDSIGTLTVTAVGDNNSSATPADGTITITTADAATTAVLTASAGITISSLDSATDVTLSAGANSTLANVQSMTDLTIANTKSTGSAITYTATAGDVDVLETVTATGSKSVTFVVSGADLVTSAAASGSAVVATDNTTGGTTTLKLSNASGGALSLASIGFDVIDLAADNSTSALTLASGANLKVSVDQTDLTLTTSAAPGRTASISLDHATDATGVTVGDISATNFASLSVALTDADAAYTLSTISVTSSTDLNVTGAGDLTVTTFASLKSFNASAATGDITFTLVNGSQSVTTGSGADSFTIDDTTYTTYNINGGAGVDTVVFTASDDYSSGTLNFTNIEKLNVNASGVILAASQLTGDDYIVVADTNTDTLAVNVMNATGETVNLADLSASLAVITVTGGNGADTITGSSTYGMTINAGSGNDTIVGGAGNDTINGQGGSDTITLGGGSDDVVLSNTTGKDTINGFGAGDDLSITITNTTTAENVISAATTVTAFNDNDQTIVTINANTTSLLATTGVETISDFTAVSTDVKAYLDEFFTIASGDVGVVILNNGTNSYVYYVSNGADTTFDAGDITLVGVVNDHLIVAANLSQA